ncbi:MAG: amino acid ABC transporter substrate-binding protein [Anaerolineales bacterium]|nr:amino acid ABC transporter substrate-binding protein [Anaerolineales bacterium]
MPRKRAWLLCLLLLLAAACGGGSTWQQVQARGTLRVGLDPTYPPFELADGIPLEGLDVDLARALAADLGLTAEFTHYGYDGLYDALLTEQVDVLISALVIAPERTADFAYSEPYFNAGQVLILPADAAGIGGMADLDGRSLAVELGAQGHLVATEWARRLPALAVLPHDTPDAALAAVAAGQADAALVDAVSGRLYLKAHPAAALRRLPEPITVEPYAIVVRAPDQALLRELNASLARLQASGELARITDDWLGE